MHVLRRVLHKLFHKPDNDKLSEAIAVEGVKEEEPDRAASAGTAEYLM